MTNGPTPTPPPRNEGEHARKLALAILSTLEKKGLLTELDVNTILHAAYRSASAAPQAGEGSQSGASQPDAPQPGNALQATTSVPKSAETAPVSATPAPPPGPAALSTRWVKASAADNAGDVTPNGTSALDNAVAPPVPAEPEAQAPVPEAEKPSIKPLVIDFTLD